MRKRFALIAAMLLTAATMFAQDASRADIFGGYQYTRIGIGSGTSGENFNGWNAALTGYKGALGLTADFAGAYRDFSGVDVKVHTYMFGPTFAPARDRKVSPFAHALFGGARASAIGVSENGFAMALGGGVDAAVGTNFAIRVVQVDYLMTRFSGENDNHARISAGIVFRF